MLLAGTWLGLKLYAQLDQDKLILEALDVPRVTCLVSPTVVDFTTTPVVEVNVEYHDATSRVDFNNTLTFTDRNPGQFSFEVAEGASKAYTVTITYYLADDQRADEHADRSQRRHPPQHAEQGPQRMQL